jgi:hypothetical protein
MRDRQMQLNLTNGRGCRPANLRGHRRSRSQRWFELMRQAVEVQSDRATTPLKAAEAGDEAKATEQN